MDNESRIAFPFGSVKAIVVDPVAIEGQRRVAEQQARIDLHRPSMLPRRERCQGLSTTPRRIKASVDDVLALRDHEFPIRFDPVLHGNEAEWAGPAFLQDNIFNVRGPHRPVADL